jgi:two-component system chemotaxis sensor kinase CheA
MEDKEILKEFLIESSENLSRLDREMVELERRPGDADLLASIFRTVHTIKGTCGFLNFHVLERITHHAENILSQLRKGDRPLTPDLVSIILETVDAVKAELASIEATEKESGKDWAALVTRQEAAISGTPATATAAPESTASDPAKNVAAADSTIRVDVALLNKLMNLVGELVLARNQILQFNAQQEDPVLNATSQRLNLITTELQEGVTKTRMQPIGTIWNKMPRIVRDLAASFGKQIDLEMDGASTELDRTVIEAIKDPLTHIVRNCCDHGIESPVARTAAGKPAKGRITFRAFHEGGNVNIEISDDGKGIDPQAIKNAALQKGNQRRDQIERMDARQLINLVFLPGLSTAQQVSNVSGRGVGMDVVKSNIEKIGGTVDLSSRVGIGTTIKIKIPLTLAIIPGLVVTSGGERFVIPQVSLLELVRLEGDAAARQIEKLHGTLVYRRRGSLLPLARLNEVLWIGDASKKAEGAEEAINIVVLQAEDRQFGLIVDGISDTQEIVVKPLGAQLKGLKCYAGATIMGDGKVSLILDVAGLALLAGITSSAREIALNEQIALNGAAATDRQALLLFRAGAYERLAVPLSMVARLEEIPAARIERAARGMVVQYRGEILPLVPLAAQIEGTPAETAVQDPALVIVFADRDRRIGLVVEQIVDIVEDTVAVRKASAQTGLLGSAVVSGKVTDFLDLHAVIRGFEEGWFEEHSTRLKQMKVLIAEESSFTRGLLRGYMEMAGHRVIEASTAREALDRLGKAAVDVVLTALDLPDRGAIELRNAIRREPGLAHLPLLALRAGAEELPNDDHGPLFAECLSKFDRPAMLNSLNNLAIAIGCRAGEPAPLEN